MIIPTWRAVGAMAAGAPVALGFALVEEEWWITGPAWIAAVLVLMLVDTLLMRRPGQIGLAPELPRVIETDRPAQASFRLEGRRPLGLEAALETDSRIDPHPLSRRLAAGSTTLGFTLVPRRRGAANLIKLHLRWSGPLGLVRQVQARRLDHMIPIIPQISLVREEAIRLFSRNRMAGSALQFHNAESMEFHALREFQTGDDPRGVNWRQSARHAKLVVRETQAERNRTIMLALDTGHLMCAPLAGGVPRLDHALNAALLVAYVSLKVGDRVGLFAFDSRPVLASGTVAGTASFGALQRMAAGLDYSAEETNFTLGMTALDATLGSRSLVIVFTDFVDPTAAELMIENVGRLLATHLVLFVAFQDDELTGMADAEPADTADVSRAVVAGSLLAERERVLARLHRLGAEIIDAPARQLGPALISNYLRLKRQNRL